jgi:hypothetical protein
MFQRLNQEPPFALRSSGLAVKPEEPSMFSKDTTSKHKHGSLSVFHAARRTTAKQGSTPEGRRGAFLNQGQLKDLREIPD